MVWDKAWLEESHAVLGGASYEVVLTCPAVLMAQQATQRHFPRLHIGLKRAVGEGFALRCTIP